MIQSPLGLEICIEEAGGIEDEFDESNNNHNFNSDRRMMNTQIAGHQLAGGSRGVSGGVGTIGGGVNTYGRHGRHSSLQIPSQNRKAQQQHAHSVTVVSKQQQQQQQYQSGGHSRNRSHGNTLELPKNNHGRHGSKHNRNQSHSQSRSHSQGSRGSHGRSQSQSVRGGIYSQQHQQMGVEMGMYDNDNYNGNDSEHGGYGHHTRGRSYDRNLNVTQQQQQYRSHSTEIRQLKHGSNNSNSNNNYYGYGNSHMNYDNVRHNPEYPNQVPGSYRMLNIDPLVTTTTGVGGGGVGGMSNTNMNEGELSWNSWGADSRKLQQKRSKSSEARSGRSRGATKRKLKKGNKKNDSKKKKEVRSVSVAVRGKISNLPRMRSKGVGGNTVGGNSVSTAPRSSISHSNTVLTYTTDNPLFYKNRSSNTRIEGMLFVCVFVCVCVCVKNKRGAKGTESTQFARNCTVINVFCLR